MQFALAQLSARLCINRSGRGLGLTDEEIGGISPSVSQTWDFETLSTYSQNPPLDDLPEEPEKPSCRIRMRARLKCIGNHN